MFLFQPLAELSQSTNHVAKYFVVFFPDKSLDFGIKRLHTLTYHKALWELDQQARMWRYDMYHDRDTNRYIAIL